MSAVIVAGDLVHFIGLDVRCRAAFILLQPSISMPRFVDLAVVGEGAAITHDSIQPAVMEIRRAVYESTPNIMEAYKWHELDACPERLRREE